MKKLISVYLILIPLLLVGCSGGDNTPDRPDFNTPPTDSNPFDPDNPDACVAVDTDGDGLIDCKDPDIDNDGILNDDDIFPLNLLEWADADSDGVGDNSDWAPNDAQEQKDSDSDGVGDWADPDDDNDGVPDVWDAFDFDSLEFFDIDFDGLGQASTDPDNDNDGTPNHWDDLMFDRRGGFDIDGDFLPNSVDDDIDGDSVFNALDKFVYDNQEWDDTDLDKIGNNADPDDDNDGVPDVWDDFSLISRTQYDSDGDGYANRDDIFPYDPTEWVDTDGDGVGDNSDAFPNNSFEWKDNDQDGIGDNADLDIDGDGFGNLAFNSYCQELTSFGENYCESPAHPYSAMRKKHRANSENAISETVFCEAIFDNIGASKNARDFTSELNNVDCDNQAGCYWDSTHSQDYDYEDYSNDLTGIKTVVGQCKPDPAQKACSWNKIQGACTVNDELQQLGYNYCKSNGNSSDCQDVPGCFWQGTQCIPEDFFSFDSREVEDLDRDGYGDGEDPDDDNDGIPDVFDQFPRRADTWFDFDNDGLFDWIVPKNEGEVYSISPNPQGMATDAQKGDPDSDNDGIPDRWDDFPWDPVEFADIDGDGLGNKIDQDDDGDGVPDDIDSCPIDVGGIIVNLCQFDPTESADTDADGLGNNLDSDDDNDGVPDHWDTFPLNSLGYSDYSQNGVADQISIDIDGDFTVNGDLDCTGGVCTYPDSEDAFIWDEREQFDNEPDGLGDNEDPDDDNDGVPDVWDDFLQTTELPDVGYFDIDQDGNVEQFDDDLDGDNVINSEDEFPYDFSESIDTDGDGIGNFVDVDDDNDGVPDFMDDLPLDPNGWFDSDGDGIDNRLDVLTPFGVRNKAELLIALTNNEQAGITESFDLDECISVPAGARIFSSFDLKTVSYTGPDDNCIFNVEGNEASVSNVILKTDETSSGITAFTTTNPQESFSLRTIDFKLFGNDNMVAKMQIQDIFALTLSNILMDIENDRGPGKNSLIEIETSGTAPELTKTIFVAGNIFFLDFDVDQLTEFNFINVINPVKRVILSNNVISMDVNDGITAPSSSGFISADFQFGGDELLSNIFINENRINQNFGKFLNIISTDSSIASTNAKGQFNSIHGITSLGNPFFETFISEDTGNPEPAYLDIYDFDEEDTFLDPSRGQYAMFYYPNTDLVENSPALFDNVAEQGFGIEIVIGYVNQDDPNSQQVNYVGVYPPALDTDGDRYADYEDVFPFDETEWIDTDNDGIGDNTDNDDDNDGLTDTEEDTYGSDPKKADTDGDGLNDFEEVNAYNTDPTNPDSDEDGDSDSEEISNGTDPNDPLSSKDTDGDGLTDNYERNNLGPLGCINPELTADTDGDGLNDFEEDQTYGTNPCSNDSDSDGLLDFEEINTYNTDPNNDDSDNDGRLDGEEVLNLYSDPNWVATNPINPDTDGDGSSDGQELIDGTDPTDSGDFKDFDKDGESDYLDKTPYGVWPCSNSDLAACESITPDNSQLIAELALQMQAANSCAAKVSSGTCIDSVKDLCEWNSTENFCESKTIVLTQDITLDKCFQSITGEVNLRGLESSRPQILIPSSLNSAPTCSLATSGVFHGGNTQSILTIENLRFESEDIRHIISTRGNLKVLNSEFYGSSRNGTAFVYGENNPSSDPYIVLEKSTFRSSLTNSGPQDPVMAAIQVDKSNFLSMKGLSVECNIKSHAYNLNILPSIFSCVDTVSDELSLNGTVIVLDGSTNYPTADVYTWTHEVNAGGIAESRLSRIYSNAKTLSLENNGSFTIQGSQGLRVRDGAATANTEVSGNAVVGTFGSLPNDPVYEGSFVDDFSAEYVCTPGNNADGAGIHPYYFPELPANDFFYLIDRGVDNSVQVPGAVRGVSCP